MRFPKWSPDGQHVLSQDGQGGVLLDGVRVRDGWSVGWLDNNAWLYFDDEGLWLYPRTLTYAGRVSEPAAGGGQWAARRGDGVLLLNGQPVHDNAGQPFLDREGHLAYMTSEANAEPSRYRDYTAWRDRTVGEVVAPGYARFPGEGWPRVIPTPTGVFLLTMTATGLRVRRWGTFDGYELVTGDNGNLEPDGVFADGEIKVAYWDDARHVPGLWRQPLAAQPMALPPYTRPVPAPTPPPPSPPPPPRPMKLPASVKALLTRYVARFPIPQTPGGGDAHEERCRQWALRFAEQVAFTHPNDGWGMKRADPGRPLSKDSIARQVEARLLMWDLLSGAGTGSPTLVDDPDSHDVTGQVFVPVIPTNHLAEVPDAPTPPPTPPSPPVDQPCALARLLAARLEVVEGLLRDAAQAQEQLTREVATLAAAIAATPKRGDPIEVVGEYRGPFGFKARVVSRGTL